MTKTSEAYRQGWKAYADGLNQTANPYQRQTKEWLEWDEGYKASALFEVHR